MDSDSASKRRTSLSTSALEPTFESRERLRIGTAETSSGKSHSCERPTSSERPPSEQTISVPDGRSDAILTLPPSVVGWAEEDDSGATRRLSASTPASEPAHELHRGSVDHHAFRARLSRDVRGQRRGRVLPRQEGTG